MKILISSGSIKDSPTGVFSRSYNLSKGLAQRGNNVTLLTTQNDEFVFPFLKQQREGVTIVSFPSLFKINFRKFGYDLLPIFLKSIYVLLKNYDIVHSDIHRPTSLFPCIIHRLIHKSLLVSDWQDITGPTGLYDRKSKYWKLTIGPFDNWLELYSKKISDGVIVLSEALKKKSIKLGIHSDSIFKLWGGSDIEKIQFNDSLNINRKLFNISKDDLVIVFVGLSPQDYEENLTIFNLVQKINRDGVKLKIVRTGKPFSKKFKIKHKIDNELLEVGYVDDKNYGKLLGCANIFMLMQKGNNNNLARWPNVIGDYLASGRPIIANVIGELKDLEKIFPSAFIMIQSIEEKHLYTKFKEIYENKQKLENRYHNIRKFACSQFSWDLRAEELEKIYTSLLKQIK